MEKELVHIFVIWSTASNYRDRIIEDISNNFEIIRVFNMHWDEDKFLDNYIVFYAHSQKHLNRNNLLSLLKGKMYHCGTGKFTAIVFRDHAPKMEPRETSNGIRIVNSHVFDKKTEYRKLSGGGHRIHGSDDAWETNKDLTLLFGLNTEDFLRTYQRSSREEITLNTNCIGVSGYQSIQQLFYVLNNTICYCVLRNYECIPDEYTVEGHGDIDLLVEDRNYITYLTLAKPVFEEAYRVYCIINIGQKEVPFDFRHIGDNYYDSLWEKHILKDRILEKGLFYVPNDEDEYYSLLYHAYIQKYEVKSDYPPKLLRYGNKICVEYSPDRQSCIKQLDSFMMKHKYEYIRPNDKSVVYNEKALEMSDYALRYGHCIKRVEEDGANGYIYSSKVYEKKDSFVKIGTKWILSCEAKFYEELRKEAHFPNLLMYEEKDKVAKMEMSRIKGVDFETFFNNANNQKGKLIKSFILEVLVILKSLTKHNICHRDFLPSNLIVEAKNEGLTVGLIDFGWPVHINDKNAPEPLHLGGRYRPSNGFSDLYTFGSLLLEYWYDVPSIRKIALILQQHKSMQVDSVQILCQAEKYAQKLFTPYDELRLFLRRHQRFHVIKQSILKRFQ